MTSVLNTAGEWEREIRSRRSNALEALGMICAVLLVVWPFCFGWGVLGHTSWVAPVGRGLLAAGFLWAVLGSAWWHRDSPESRGLGSPGRLLRQLHEGRAADRWRVAVGFAAIFGGLLWIGLTDWPDAAKVLRLPKQLRGIPDSPGEWVAVALASAVAAVLLSTYAIRYDNLRSAFGFACQVSVVFLAYATLVAWLARGDKAFAKFAWHSHAMDIAAHTVWGLIQQLVFTGFIATRMRKAFPPTTPTMRGARGKRWRNVAVGGLISASVLGPVAWWALRATRGAPDSLPLLGACVAFAFPIGAVWAFFLTHDPRRMLGATLAGGFFGLIHIDSYGLVLVTAILGTVFAYAAMEDRFRNLAVFALMHGVLGATFAKLFGAKGFLKITISVGPWSVVDPTAADLVVPLVCLVAYALVALWVVRRFGDAGPGEPVVTPGAAKREVAESRNETPARDAAIPTAR